MTAIRFSLKWLMGGVALAAISAAALASASPAWATAIITAVGISLLAAALVAAAGAAGRRAFAVGFLIGALGYLLLWQASLHHWLLLDESDLLTQRIVEKFYELIKHEAPAARATGSSAQSAMSGGMMGPMGMGGMAGMGGGISFTVGPTFLPDQNQFQKIAHWLFAVFIGLGCGSFARRQRPGAAANEQTATYTARGQK